MLISEILGDAIEGICAYVLDQLFELAIVIICKLARVGVDDFYKFSGFLVEELRKLLELLMHLRDCLHHPASM